jgi:hypothetical protein
MLILFSTVSFAQTTVSGHITTNTSWTVSGSPYVVVQNVIVDAGVTLTVMPGVIVKFEDFNDGLYVDGSLKAIGTMANPIIFTSYPDDAHGGDTNGDGASTQAGPNQWRCIQFNNISTDNILEHTWIGYGGGNFTDATVNTFTSDLTIRNSTIAYSSLQGLHVDHSSPILEGNLFLGNATDGIFFNGFDETVALSLEDNTFQNNTNWAVIANLFNAKVDISLTGNSSTGSDHNGFGIYGWIEGNVTLDGNTDFPFIAWESVNVAEDAVLTFTPGTTLKFNDFNDGLYVDGSLQAIGTADEPIAFTALADDNYGGDTNGDGTDTEPAPNQWRCIQFNLISTNNALEHTWIGYAGGNFSDANIHTFTSDLSIRNSTIAYSVSRGLQADHSSPVLEGNLFLGNTTDGIYFNGFDDEVAVRLTDNTFQDNNNWAVLANLFDATVDITLVGNSSTGSAHNGFGMYGWVRDNVTFDDNPGFPFIAWENVNVAEDAVLTFTPGTTLKFNDFNDGLYVDGSLRAIGTAAEPIAFTALADDQHGGDTNGDGTDTDPAPNQWRCIQFNLISTNNALEHTWIGYAGGNFSDANIHTFTSELSIRNSTIAYSVSRGLQADHSSPVLEDNLFLGNTTDGIYFNGFDDEVAVRLTDNTFQDNNNWAVLANLFDATVDITLVGNSSTGSAHNGFGMYGWVRDNVTFDDNPGFPFIAWENVNVAEDAVLTFTPGTTLKFNDYNDGLYVDGSLRAIGTAAEPIAFTALADDQHGGDTNGDGADTDPAPNQWRCIQFNPISTNNALEHTWIGYAGGNFSDANIHTFTSDLSIRNSTIAYSVLKGLQVDHSSPILEDNLFLGNATDGIYFNGFDDEVAVTLTGNTFQDNNNWAVIANLFDASVDITSVGNSSTGSDHNGFGIYGWVEGNVTLDDNPGFPFIAWENISVAENAVLTFAPGTTLKFNDYNDGLYVDGSLRAIGTAEKPIAFTALADDLHGGDTNGDGTDTEPGPNRWRCIQFNEISINNALEYAWIGYAGGNFSDANVNIFTSDLTIKNSNILESSDIGIYINGASPRIERCNINDNSRGIFTTNQSLPQLINNNIYDNTGFGVYNSDGSVEVNALNTWWGSTSGPYHPSKNTAGTGNEVSDFVLFEPWLNEPAGPITDVEYLLLSPLNFSLGDPFPNPAIDLVNIGLEIQSRMKVKLVVMDVRGIVIEVIADEIYHQGNHNIVWNCGNYPPATYMIIAYGARGRASKLIVKQ